MPVSLEKLEPYVIPERRARYARVSIWLRTHAVLVSLMVLFCSASLRLVMISRADMNQLVADYSDAGTYFIPAQNLIDQREFLNNKGKPMITRTPGYPVFLAGIMLLVVKGLLKNSGCRIWEMPGFDFDPAKIVNLAKTLSINLLFNFAIFLFLPLKNRQILILLLPFYLAATLAYLNGYLFPLSGGSWHGNAVIPLILLGYIKEFEKLPERQTKINVLKVGFTVAVFLFVAIQYLRPAYSSGIWPIISKYPDLRKDYDVIQSIKDTMKDQPILVSFQLGKYFGDFKDVNLLENESKIGPNIQYLVYYSGGGSLDDQRLREIKQNYSATKQYKDVILFEKLATD